MCQQELRGIARRHIAPTALLTSNPRFTLACLSAKKDALFGSSKENPRDRAAATSQGGSQLASIEGVCVTPRKESPEQLPPPSTSAEVLYKWRAREAKSAGSDVLQTFERAAWSAAWRARSAASLVMSVPHEGQIPGLPLPCSPPRAVRPWRSQ